MERLEVHTVAGWTVPIRLEGPLYTHRVGIVLPGSGYTPAHPLLYYARRVLADHDLSVAEVWWDEDWSRYESGEDEQLLAGLRSAVAAVADEVERRGGTVALWVGKSLGTRALAVASGDPRIDDTPAIWLTPILASHQVQAAVERRRAPTLLVAGTGDDLTDVDALHRAEAAGCTAHRVQGGDHALEVGDAERSLAVLTDVVRSMAQFVGQHLTNT